MPVIAPEPYTGYYASDPVWPPAICAELYTLMGPETRTHYHPLTNAVTFGIQDGGTATGTATGALDGGTSSSTLTGVFDGGSAFG